MCAEDGFRPVPRLIQSSIAVISSSILPPALRLPSFACQAVALAEAGGSSFLRSSSFVLLHSKHVLRGKPAISKQ